MTRPVSSVDAGTCQTRYEGVPLQGLHLRHQPPEPASAGTRPRRTSISTVDRHEPRLAAVAVGAGTAMLTPVTWWERRRDVSCQRVRGLPGSGGYGPPFDRSHMTDINRRPRPVNYPRTLQLRFENCGLAALVGAYEYVQPVDVLTVRSLNFP